jgi:predicted dehydrogenase
LAQTEGACLTAIVEPDQPTRDRLAAEHSAPAFDRLQDALPHLDAAICAAPTSLHEQIGVELLSRGVPVLMEKPLSDSPASAARLCEAASLGNCVLQVGHVERFNPALQAVAHHLREPRMLLAERTSGFTFRSTDVGVVLDLMIHDIDIALKLHGGQVKDVRAVGGAVLGPHEDWAHAQLLFDNGAVASLTASRVQGEARRRMRVACEQTLADLDFAGPGARVLLPSPAMLRGELSVDQLSDAEIERLREGGLAEHLPALTPEMPKINAILEEQRDFVRAIRQGGSPRVTGNDGLRAVEIAERILQAIHHAPAIMPDVIPWPHPTWSSERRAG